MRKVYIKNRDELIVLQPDVVAYLLADGDDVVAVDARIRIEK